MPRVHSILQYNRKPSQALAAAEFWIRLLIETRIASKEGHVIGDVLRLRKLQEGDIIITAIEVEQRQEDPTVAQRYLDACAWWLHRAPFGVKRLPVKLSACDCHGSLVRVKDWHLTSLVLKTSKDTLDLATLGDLLPHLKTLQISFEPAHPGSLLSPGLLSCCDALETLHLCHTDIDDVTVLPVKTLSALSLRGCDGVTDIRHLSGAKCLADLNLDLTEVSDLSALRSCGKLRKVSLWECWNVQDLSALAGPRYLEEICATQIAVRTITDLGTCTSLRIVNFMMCAQLEDLSPLAGLQYLEEIYTACSAVRTITGLGTCTSLWRVEFCWCQHLTDLSPLAGAAKLEEINATSSGVRTITGLDRCTSLRKVDFNQCQQLMDLSVFARAAKLEEIHAASTAVSTITGLGTCTSLRTVDFRWCGQLTDLSPLAGAAKLEEVTIRGSGVNAEQCKRQFPGCHVIVSDDW